MQITAPALVVVAAVVWFAIANQHEERTPIYHMDSALEAYDAMTQRLDQLRRTSSIPHRIIHVTTTSTITGEESQSMGDLFDYRSSFAIIEEVPLSEMRPLDIGALRVHLPDGKSAIAVHRYHRSGTGFITRGDANKHYDQAYRLHSRDHIGRMVGFWTYPDDDPNFQSGPNWYMFPNRDG